jgi:putative spermidine/putrescine transport system ATP-binding protein
MSDLELRSIRKTFQQTVAVQNLSLKVETGEFVTLLGPSGCGKTTTLKIIAGFEVPDTGDVLIKGQVITQLAPYRRDIGMVFQSYALFPHMTVFENVAYGLRMRKVARPEIERRVQEALELVRLPDLGQRYPRQLSGGQQQRVAVARAVVISPSLLLFDEPLSNLDAKLRDELRDELRELQRSLRITTIYVTHDQEEALSMSDRVVIMNQGKIEQEGTPEALYTHPRTSFVASFLGRTNLIDGQVTSKGPTVAKIATAGGVVLLIPARWVFAEGQRGKVAIRPESIRLLPVDTTPPEGMNCLSAQVKQVTYLGANRRYQVLLPDETEIIVQQQAGIGEVLGPQPRPGETVQIVWDLESGSFQEQT